MSPRTISNHSHIYSKSKRHYFRSLFIIFIFIILAFITYKAATFNISSNIPEIKSGIAGYCIDAKNDSSLPGTNIETWPCNGTDAQHWVINGREVIHDKNSCLSIANNSSLLGSKIVAEPCKDQSGQIWVATIDGLENPSSAGCLTLPAKHLDQQLILGSCKLLTQAPAAWMTTTYNSKSTTGAFLGCKGSKGEMIACIAAEQWSIWNSDTSNHTSLLNNYSDGNSYEEWCADFVSYVYKEAGYPFTNGERNNWDEYYAPNIQNQGFTYEPPSDYTPKAGDIAFFNYNGGHVEIVAVGGARPIFIYGDSGTVDKTSGNGNMAENTITNDGVEGQLIYYLTPS